MAAGGQKGRQLRRVIGPATIAGRRGSAASRGCFSFTKHGRGAHHQIEPAVDDFTRELRSSRQTVEKAAGVANQGWKLLNEALRETGPRPRVSNPHDVTFLRHTNMTGDLGTTNLLLGIMAVVSVLEALVVVGVGSLASWR